MTPAPIMYPAATANADLSVMKYRTSKTTAVISKPRGNTMSTG